MVTIPSLNMMKLYKNRNNHRITLTAWRWWQRKHWEEFSAKFGAKFRNGDVMMTAVPIHWLLSQFTLSCSIRRLYFWWFRRLIMTSKLDRLCLRNLVPRVLSLPTSRKYPGCGWSRVYVYKSNPHRGWVFDLIVSKLSMEEKVALPHRRYFES